MTNDEFRAAVLKFYPSLRQFAIREEIPYRTVQYWAANGLPEESAAEKARAVLNRLNPHQL